MIGTKKVEKVRGMNAALAAGSGPATSLSEREAPRVHITRRQVALALVLAILGVIAAMYTVGAITSGQQTFPAVVTTSKVYDLNFASTGKVTTILVKPGQRVNKNQPLAEQDASSLQLEVAADQAAVKADQAAVQQAESPQLSGAQRLEDSLQIQQAQTALTNAQQALSAAVSAGHASVASAQAAAGSDQSLVNSDTARYNQACPNGPVPPAANLTGSALQAAENLFTQCENLQFQMDRDQATLNTAQAQVSSVSSQAQQAIDSAAAQVNSAQSALNLAESQQAVQSAPSDPTTLAQAQAALSQAETQLTQAQQALAETTLAAPDAGVVSEVHGAPGEYLGPSGVQQYQGPSALPSTQSSGFQLFPAQPQPAGSTTNSGSQPLIELIGGQQQITAQIPESEVASYGVGHTATVMFSTLHDSTTATITDMVLEPSRDPGSVTYDIVLTLSHPIPSLLPGMSAAVRAN